MGREFELKYRASTEQLAGIKAAFPGDYTLIPMETTYYDTPGGALSAKYFTLRHRQEGDKHICTLKTPAGNGARNEFEAECPDILEALEPLSALSGEELPRELVVSCGAKFTRQAVLLELGGCTAELALDQGVLRNGERQVEFAEAELELKSGDRNALVAFGRLFAGRFGLTVEHKSKFARAKALGQEGQNGCV